MQTHTEPPFSYGSWIYNYLCNQCISPLMWVRISIKARCTKLCDEVCQWLATGRWFSPGPPVSSTNQADRHHITSILLKVALNTIKQTNKQTNSKQTHARTPIRNGWMCPTCYLSFISYIPCFYCIMKIDVYKTKLIKFIFRKYDYIQ